MSGSYVQQGRFICTISGIYILTTKVGFICTTCWIYIKLGGVYMYNMWDLYVHYVEFICTLCGIYITLGGVYMYTRWGYMYTRWDLYVH